MKEGERAQVTEIDDDDEMQRKNLLVSMIALTSVVFVQCDCCLSPCLPIRLSIQTSICLSLYKGFSALFSGAILQSWLPRKWRLNVERESRYLQKNLCGQGK